MASVPAFTSSCQSTLYLKVSMCVRGTRLNWPALMAPVFLSRSLMACSGGVSSS